MCCPKPWEGSSREQALVPTPQKLSPQAGPPGSVYLVGSDPSGGMISPLSTLASQLHSQGGGWDLGLFAVYPAQCPGPARGTGETPETRACLQEPLKLADPEADISRGRSVITPGQRPSVPTAWAAPPDGRPPQNPFCSLETLRGAARRPACFAFAPAGGTACAFAGVCLPLLRGGSGREALCLFQLLPRPRPEGLVHPGSVDTC